MNLGRSRKGARVNVDNDKCELYGICEAEAPTLFELGPDGRLRYRRSPADEDMALAAAAARSCPMQAIKLESGNNGRR
jgi:ferredoxin